MKDIHPSTSSSLFVLASLVESGGTLFFVAREAGDLFGLWKSDGTSAGTVRVDAVPALVNATPIGLIDADGTLFLATGRFSGSHLWKTDGTSEGTQSLVDVPGTASATPTWLTDVDGTLYFAALDPTPNIDNELFRSDGTEAGTQLVANIRTPFGSEPSALTALNGEVLFEAFQVGPGSELWKSDGTVLGTVLVKDILPGTANSQPAQLTRVGDTVFFTAAGQSAGSDTGRELWKTDGTEAGTLLVKDITPGASSSSLSQLVPFGGALFFVELTRLWTSDGTEAGTLQLSAAAPVELEATSDALYFAVGSGGRDSELWKSDGTPAGTVRVKQLIDKTGSAFTNERPEDLTSAGSTLYFAAEDGVHGNELWKSDGTEAGTVLVKDILPGTSGAFPGSLAPANGTLFFAASDSEHGRELWKSDGTEAGTVLVRDIRPGTSGSSPTSLTAVGSVVVFAANDGVSGNELWTSDGTAEGTRRVADLASLGSSGPQNFRQSGSLLYFTATTNATGNELFAIPVAALTDADLDGLQDADERALGTDELEADTDGDGLADGDEVNTHGTDPLAADTDGDGFGDGDEIAAGTGPLDPQDFPLSVPLLPAWGGVLLSAALLLAAARRRTRAA